MPTGKKIRKSTAPAYASYLHKVLKHVAPPGVTISSKAMEVVNSLIEDVEARLSKKAFDLATFDKKSTLSAKHVQTATKIILPGQMSDHGIAEGSKAVTKYTQSLEEDAKMRRANARASA